MKHPAARSCLCALAVLALAAGPASLALTDEEIFRDLRFNLMNAGPRAAGLGGAFVAIADDASAVDANPAGLYALAEPRFFVELRHLDDDTRVTSGQAGSRRVDPVTGARDLPLFGVTSVAATEAETKPTFLSVAWPLRFGTAERRLALVGSRQIVLSRERSLSDGPDATATVFAFDSFPNTSVGSGSEAYAIEAPVAGVSRSEIVYWTVGAALEVHPDFSFGCTVSYATLDLEADTLTRVIDPEPLFRDPVHPRLTAQPTTDLFRSTIDDTDEGLAFSVGIHWHPDSAFANGRSPWRLGASFRRGAEFDVRQSTSLNGVGTASFLNRVVVPDRYSVGGSWTEGPWTIVAEVERVEYSDMLDGFRTGVNFLTSNRLVNRAFGVDPAARVRYDVDDGSIPRVGAEYVLPRASGTTGTLSLRGGYYRSPDSRIRMASFNSNDPAVNAVYLDAFRGGEDQDHFTAGVGYAMGRSTFEVAGDFADDGFQVVGSYTFRMSHSRRTP